MKFSITEILAGTLVMLSAIKLLVIAANAKTWVSFAKRLYSHPNLVVVISIALAGFVLHLLLISGLTIVQILAVSLFVSLLMTAGIAPYSSLIFAVFETESLTDILSRQWLYILIWLLLLVWGAYEILTKEHGAINETLVRLLQ